MVSRLGRYWRVVGTGFSFFAFGLAGLVLGFLVFPILRVVIPDAQRRQATSRELLRWCFRWHIAVMRGVGIIRYSFSGLERLDRSGLLIVSNHPSLIDAVLLMAFIRNADCVIDAALFENKYTRSAVRAAGYIPNQPSGLPLVDACLASLDRGGNLLFFPESRRTTPGELLQLTRGAAQVAVRGGRDLTPVVIHCTPPHLPGARSGGAYRRVARSTRSTCTPTSRCARSSSDSVSRRCPPGRSPTNCTTTSPRNSWRMPSLEEEVKRLIIEALQLEDVTPGDIDTDAPLFGDGLGLDSIDALELGVAIRKRYRVEFSAEASDTRRHFASVRALMALIEGSQGAAT